jgi:hypothetical protein
MVNGPQVYQHREWRHEMYDIANQGMRVMLSGALRHMRTDLTDDSVGASDVQLEFMDQCLTLLKDLAARGDRILNGWHPKAVVMGDATRRAGDAAAERKEYHQR